MKINYSEGPIIDNRQFQYEALMRTIRSRLDLIQQLKVTQANGFSKCETAAFHGRKIIEGIAFGCVVALENKTKQIPRDAKGQWNAAKIFKRLQAKSLFPFPSPSIIRAPTSEEEITHDVTAVVEGIVERRLSPNELISFYDDFHKWLHELNPYVGLDQSGFLYTDKNNLWANLQRLERFIERHTITIGGIGFFCTLRDSGDGSTKVISLSKISS